MRNLPRNVTKRNLYKSHVKIARTYYFRDKIIQKLQKNITDYDAQNQKCLENLRNSDLGGPGKAR